MQYVSLALACSAILIALIAWIRAAAHASRISELERDLVRQARDLTTETEQALTLQRRMLAKLAAGEGLDGDMIEEGRLWRDVTGSEALALVDDASAHILDVRTPREVVGGYAEGAKLIPVNELEARAHELPRDGKPLIIYCAAGVRSAAACDYLSSLGHDGLYNLAGGFAAWIGPRATS